jgi:hypothetical protein
MVPVSSAAGWSSTVRAKKTPERSDPSDPFDIMSKTETKIGRQNCHLVPML